MANGKGAHASWLAFGYGARCDAYRRRWRTIRCGKRARTNYTTLSNGKWNIDNRRRRLHLCLDFHHSKSVQNTFSRLIPINCISLLHTHTHKRKSPYTIDYTHRKRIFLTKMQCDCVHPNQRIWTALRQRQSSSRHPNSLKRWNIMRNIYTQLYTHTTNNHIRVSVCVWVDVFCRGALAWLFSAAQNQPTNHQETPRRINLFLGTLPTFRRQQIRL